jgi:nitroreductase
MDVFEAIRQRRSIRHYLNQAVEEEKINRILEAARLAPSARNRQEWRFVVVQNDETRKRLSVAARGQQFVAQAPVVIVCCSLESEYMMTCGQYAYTIDLSIAIDHMTLAATELGLGTCWIGAFYEDQVKVILSIPDRIRVVELLTLGYSEYQPQPTHRKRLSEIVCYEKWTE